MRVCYKRERKDKVKEIEFSLIIIVIVSHIVDLSCIGVS